MEAQALPGPHPTKCGCEPQGKRLLPAPMATRDRSHLVFPPSCGGNPAGHFGALGVTQCPRPFSLPPRVVPDSGRYPAAGQTRPSHRERGSGGPGVTWPPTPTKCGGKATGEGGSRRQLATLPLQDTEEYLTAPCLGCPSRALQQGGSLGSGADLLHPLGCCVSKAAARVRRCAFVLAKYDRSLGRPSVRGG